MQNLGLHPVFGVNPATVSQMVDSNDIALHEINQEFESQRLQLQQANTWADQAQRDKISLHGELELRKSLVRENQAKDWQEIEELRRTGCEETDRVRPARIDELFMHLWRSPTTVSQMVDSNSGFVEKGVFLV